MKQKCIPEAIKGQPIFGRLFLILYMLVSFQQVYGQIYLIRNTSTKRHMYYNIANNSWHALPDSTGVTNNPPTPTSGIMLVNRYQYFIGGVSSGSATLATKNPLDNTWTTSVSTLPEDPQYGASYIKASFGEYVLTDNKLYRKNGTTWEAKANIPLSIEDGGGGTVAGNYIYASVGGNGSASRRFFRYDPVSNTWTELATMPGAVVGTAGSIAGAGNFVYVLSENSNVTTLKVYDIAAGTWSIIAAPLLAGTSIRTKMVMVGDTPYIFATSYNGTFFRYNPGSSTFTQLAEILPNAGSIYNVIYDLATPSGSITVVQATCTGNTSNSNGSIQFTNASNVTRIGYSAGSAYSGPAYAAATSFTTTSGIIANTLPNPGVAQPYTIRLFSDATTYVDQVVVLQPTLCASSDLSLTLTPTSQTKNPGEVATYVATLTNGGPSTATNVRVRVQIPSNTTFIGAVPQQGTYDEATNIWTVPSVPTGTQTLTLNLRLN